MLLHFHPSIKKTCLNCFEAVRLRTFQTLPTVLRNKVKYIVPRFTLPASTRPVVLNTHKQVIYPNNNIQRTCFQLNYISKFYFKIIFSIKFINLYIPAYVYNPGVNSQECK